MTADPAGDLLTGLLDDLDTEGRDLSVALDGLGDDGWRALTPAAGWDVATTVAHLAWTDDAAVLAAGAVTGGDAGKTAWDELVLAAMADPEGFVDAAAIDLAASPRGELLQRWHASRTALRETLAALPDGAKLPWFGPPMSAASMATARLMETWAHAIDVHDAAGRRPPPTDRIRAVAHLGVRTRDFAFASRGEVPPAEPFWVELTAPSGVVWTWGPVGAEQRVNGSAYDFCLLVTQRAHRSDVDLVAVGGEADRWLEIAQAFAGPPGAGREPSLG